MSSPLESVASWLTYDDVAAELGVSRSRVRHLVKEHQLASVRRPERGEPVVPTELVQQGRPVKGLSGTLTLLTDHGFDDAEALEWLFTDDDSLPGRPVDALREDRGREVRRRAQALD